MCEVTVRQNMEGRFQSIETRYCDNHPACCKLKGRLIREREPSKTAPVSPVTPTSGVSSTPSPSPVSPVSILKGSANNPLSGGDGYVVHRGGGRMAFADSDDGRVVRGGAHLTYAESAEGQELSKSPASRIKRSLTGTAWTLRTSLAKLTITPITRTNKTCCIRLGFAYRCGHAVKMDPPVRGYACSKDGCRHSNTTHLISVPLQFPCSWTERCNSEEVASRAVLFETTGGQPEWRAVMMEENKYIKSVVI